MLGMTQGEVKQSTPEAGTPEAGTPEAGTPEAGTPEAGTPEAGTPEAGGTELSGPEAARDRWGRVDAEGTVFVVTSEGERSVGSWKAGAPEEGLAHFARRYEQLSTEMTLLEQRLRSGVGDPAQVAASARRLRDGLPTAAAVGDLSALELRAEALLERTAAAVQAHQAARAESRAQAVVAKTALAEEAERLGASSDWKGAGERLRALGEDWKGMERADRKTDDELWGRVAAARKRFTERRTTHFAALGTQREVSKERKERILRQAEELQGSTDWKPTAERYKQLMSEWKTAGRAPHDVEDALWMRFKAAQDTFFSARSAAFSAQDEQLRGNQSVKEQILAEAERLDVGKGLESAKREMRALQERWEAAGKVPRDALRTLEGRMQAVEERVREAAGARSSAPPESPFAARLREKVEELEGKLGKAEAAGRPTEELQAALSTQREWLAQAGGSSRGAAPTATPPPPAGAPRPPKKDRPRTTAWVRAE